MDNFDKTINGKTVIRGRGLLARFKRDRSGSVAIEFTLLALPFFLLVFAIIETCVAFGAQQIMANAADIVSRDIRVGELKTAAATQAEVRKRICDELSVLVTSGCPGLEIDLKSYSRYADVPTTIPRTSNNDVNTSGFTVSVAGPSEKHHLRIFYRWPYYTDFIGSKMAELPNGKTLIYASATWQNENFNP